jgi:hypothetical protein
LSASDSQTAVLVAGLAATDERLQQIRDAQRESDRIVVESVQKASVHVDDEVPIFLSHVILIIGSAVLLFYQCCKQRWVTGTRGDLVPKIFGPEDIPPSPGGRGPRDIAPAGLSGDQK